MHPDRPLVSDLHFGYPQPHVLLDAMTLMSLGITKGVDPYMSPSTLPKSTPLVTPPSSGNTEPLTPHALRRNPVPLCTTLVLRTQTHALAHSGALAQTLVLQHTSGALCTNLLGN
ncbi:hypothetical protein SCLCIDRAFT_33786 [Scleroderma citrinum Foug A]|uniref:Uncharacterized protein n=1 Tax=Scleroderma citrinum Foug A TaxID=1036808 RepID=A0A0C3D3R8_9AGAM|nr:hypothetical protein SCLCIDRAFT_33786 [Scleroderma citrinum Foug A]